MEVYISPHPDDAVLSCGGRLLKTSEKLVVINVFTKKYNGLTTWDKQCGIKDNPMQKRIMEDKKILSSVGAESIYLDFYDQAVYDDLKNKSRPQNETTKIKKQLKEIINNLSPDKLFFPAGIKHLDHKLLRTIGDSFQCKFYEDLPYGIEKSVNNFVLYPVQTVIKKKIDLILKYKSQIKGLLLLTNSKNINDLKRKLLNHHYFDDSYYEKIIE